MKKSILFLLVWSILIAYSCGNQYEKIAGYWEVKFADSASYTKQILHFQKDRGRLMLTIDEPVDGTLEMPGENPFFSNDSLHYESLWGLFNYDGKFVAGDSIIRGVRVVNSSNPAPFTMKRITKEELGYKIPRVNTHGVRVHSYAYHQPLQKDDGLECAALSEAGIDSTLICNLVEEILNGNMATIHSLLMAKDNKLVLEEYFHTYHGAKLHSLESVTKSVTSALMGIAIDQQLISGVDEPVLNYLEKWDSTQWVRKEYDIRIKHLLTMTAGLDWKPFTPNEYNDDMNIYLSPDYIAYILNKDLKDKPGETFFYNNRLMFLQGHMIKQSSGMSVDSFATNYLFNELGIKQHKWKVYPNGITETGGGLKLLPRDMLKIGLMYLTNGKWQDKQIISREWIQSSIKKQISAGNQDYGYNWWIKHYTVGGTEFHVYYALGHGEQTIMVIPDANVVFVMTAGNYFQKPQRLDEILSRYILPSLSINNDKANRPIRNMRDLVGEYKINDYERIIIELVESRLVAIDPSGARLNPEYAFENIKCILKNENKVVTRIIDHNWSERLALTPECHLPYSSYSTYSEGQVEV